MSEQRRLPMIAGLLAFGVFAVGMILFLLHASGVRSPTSDFRMVQTVLPEAANLAVKADVRMGGVKVGQVTDVRVVGDNVVAELQLTDDAGPVYRNARTQLRYKSPLQEGYIDLVRGGGKESRQLPDGGILPISAAEETVQVDQVLSTLDEPTRRSLQGTLDGLSGGLDGQGRELNDMFAAVSATVDRGEPLLDTLAAQSDDAARLIDHFGEVASALGDRETALQVLARRGRVAAEAVAAREERVREVFEQLPSTLAQARASSSRLAGLSGSATPVLGDMRVALDELAPAIRRLRPAARETRTTVQQLQRFLPRAEPLLDSLKPFAGEAERLTGPLDELMRQLNPLSGYVSEQRNNITAFFSNYSAATKSVDQTGHLNSLSFLFNKEALTAALPADGDEALQALEDAGILSAIGGRIQQNPYPADGEIGDPVPFEGSYRRLKALPPMLSTTTGG